MKTKFRLLKKARYFLYILLAVVLFASCNEFMPSDGRYYIKDLKEYRQYTKYHIIQVKGHGHAFLRDSVGKYHVGDTIIFVPYNR